MSRLREAIEAVVAEDHDMIGESTRVTKELVSAYNEERSHIEPPIEV